MTNSSSDEFMRAHEVICGEGCHTSKSTGPLEPLSQGRLVLVDECSKDVLKEPSAVGLARGLCSLCKLHRPIASALATFRQRGLGHSSAAQCTSRFKAEN